MTRNNELDLEDLFTCDHSPSVPVSRDGRIVGWMCSCGKKSTKKTSKAKGKNSKPRGRSFLSQRG